LVDGRLRRRGVNDADGAQPGADAGNLLGERRERAVDAWQVQGQPRPLGGLGMDRGQVVLCSFPSPSASDKPPEKER
jgi:hypothetical protein